MKKVLIVLAAFIIGTSYGLYSRPSFFLIGQLNWYNVLTKGYFQNKVSQFFTQNMIDESFYHVLKMQGIALGISFFLLILMGFFTKTKVSKKTKK